MPPTPEAAIWADGPWQHRDVSANGIRFHSVELGEGPLVLLLHGFPTYWWTWRHQIEVLADAGYWVVAMDLRGYGGSDHTPHGYDPFTLSADVAGVIRSLGESSAILVAQGWGGLIAWSTAVLRPSAVRAIAPVAIPHPNLMRKAIMSDPEQRRLARYTLSFQAPFTPERALVKNDAARVEEILHDWSGTPGWPDPDTAAMYRAAMQFGSTAHCSIEYHRWAIRSIPRPDGRRFAKRMLFPVKQPVLEVVGMNDGSILPRSFDGAEGFVTGPFERLDMSGVGHFPHEEDPERFNALLLRWLAALP